MTSIGSRLSMWWRSASCEEECCREWTPEEAEDARIGFEAFQAWMRRIEVEQDRKNYEAKWG